jgi:hypothetical protein
MLSNHGRLTFAEIAPSDGRGAEGWRVLAAPRAPSIQEIPKLTATLGSAGAVRNSIHPPAKVWPFVNRVASVSSKSKFPA